MGPRRRPRIALDPVKQLHDRLDGLDLKINDIFILSGANIFFLVEKDGLLRGYRSREWNPKLEHVPVHVLATLQYPTFKVLTVE
jgi:hypothetical protein